MVNFIIRKIVGSQNERQVKKLRPLVAKINQIEASLHSLSDDALRQKTVAAYLSSVAYEYTALNIQPNIHEYIPAALFLAALVSIIAIGFRQFADIQRQPLHKLRDERAGCCRACIFVFSFVAFSPQGNR